jgi:transposase
VKIITDSFWNEIKSVMPKKKTAVGRPEWPARKTLEGILYILDNGCKWLAMPKEYGNAKTIHGKFIKWCKQGVFNQIHKKMVDFYKQKKTILWIAIDGSHHKSPFAEWGGKNPTDRARNGIKVHLLVDWNGAPLSCIFGPSNRHDSKFLQKSLDQLRHLFLPTSTTILAADSAYDAKKLRTIARENGYILLASTNKRRDKHKQVYHPSGRWIIERTFGWMSWYRGLKICWNKKEFSYAGLFFFACAIRIFEML